VSNQLGGAKGQLSPACEAVIAQLPANGSFVGINRLCEATGLSPRAYQKAIEELLGLGLVRKRPGRGGSLRLVVAPAHKGPSNKAKQSTRHSGRPKGVSVTNDQPAPRPRPSTSPQPLGFEATLWRTADNLRGSMDASEYKHVVLALIFLK
jgi:type I restriction enzyme M protein